MRSHCSSVSSRNEPKASSPALLSSDVDAAELLQHGGRESLRRRWVDVTSPSGREGLAARRLDVGDDPWSRACVAGHETDGGALRRETGGRRPLPCPATRR